MHNVIYRARQIVDAHTSEDVTKRDVQRGIISSATIIFQIYRFANDIYSFSSNWSLDDDISRAIMQRACINSCIIADCCEEPLMHKKFPFASLWKITRHLKEVDIKEIIFFTRIYFRSTIAGMTASSAMSENGWTTREF